MGNWLEKILIKNPVYANSSVYYQYQDRGVYVDTTLSVDGFFYSNGSSTYPYHTLGEYLLGYYKLSENYRIVSPNPLTYRGVLPLKAITLYLPKSITCYGIYSTSSVIYVNGNITCNGYVQLYGSVFSAPKCIVSEDGSTLKNSVILCKTFDFNNPTETTNSILNVNTGEVAITSLDDVLIKYSNGYIRLDSTVSPSGSTSYFTIIKAWNENVDANKIRGCIIATGSVNTYINHRTSSGWIGWRTFTLT